MPLTKLHRLSLPPSTLLSVMVPPYIVLYPLSPLIAVDQSVPIMGGGRQAGWGFRILGWTLCPTPGNS